MKPPAAHESVDPVGEMRVIEERTADSQEPELIRDQAEASADDGPLTFGKRTRTRIQQTGNGPGARPEEP